MIPVAPRVSNWHRNFSIKDNKKIVQYKINKYQKSMDVSRNCRQSLADVMNQRFHMHTRINDTHREEDGMISNKLDKHGSCYIPSGSCAMVCWRLALDIISASLRELAVRGRFILSLAGWLPPCDDAIASKLLQAKIIIKKHHHHHHPTTGTFSFLGRWRSSPWRFLSSSPSSDVTPLRPHTHTHTRQPSATIL